MADTTYTDNVTVVSAAWLNDVNSETYQSLTSVAGTNTITATGPTSLSSYSSRQAFRFIPAVTNTGATTINISSVGAKNIFSGGAALVGGELVVGVAYIIIYDGTQFNLVATSPASASFTPAITFGGAAVGVVYSHQVGTYTRSGNVCMFSIDIVLTSKGSSSGICLITSLPFTSASPTNLIQSISISGAALTSITGQLQATIAHGATTISLAFLGTGSQSNLTDTQMSDTSVLRVSGWYRV